MPLEPRALDVRLARLVVACEPPSPRALPAAEVAGAAEAAGVPAEVGGPVPGALARAWSRAGACRRGAGAGGTPGTGPGCDCAT